MGQAWPAIVAPESMGEAQETWAGLMAEPSVVRKIRFMLRRREGEPIRPRSTPSARSGDGRFVGAHGSNRDLTETEQLADTCAPGRRARATASRRSGRWPQMAAQLTSLRDPSDVLIQTLRAAVRLLKGDGGQIGMIVPDRRGRPALGRRPLAGPRAGSCRSRRRTTAEVDDGVSGRAVRERARLVDRRLPRRRLVPPRGRRRCRGEASSGSAP